MSCSVLHFSISCSSFNFVSVVGVVGVVVVVVVVAVVVVGGCVVSRGAPWTTEARPTMRRIKTNVILNWNIEIFSLIKQENWGRFQELWIKAGMGVFESLLLPLAVILKCIIQLSVNSKDSKLS